jgi:predicted RNA-binding Zn ribbon-like protein
MARISSDAGLRAQWKPFRFIGNYSCLDFVNTETKESGQRVNLLRGFEDFVTWLASTTLFEPSKLKQATKEWKIGATSERIHKNALALRQVLRGMAEAIVAGRSVPPASIRVINGLIGRPSGITKVVKTPDSFERRFELDLNEPKQLLVPIAESAARLLCSGDFSRVKQCANQDCGAFFYDGTKNNSRRWCSATGCGNRMRVAKFYARNRSDD